MPYGVYTIQVITPVKFKIAVFSDVVPYSSIWVPVFRSNLPLHLQTRRVVYCSCFTVSAQRHVEEEIQVLGRKQTDMNVYCLLKLHTLKMVIKVYAETVDWQSACVRCG